MTARAIEIARRTSGGSGCTKGLREERNDSFLFFQKNGSQTAFPATVLIPTATSSVGWVHTLVQGCIAGLMTGFRIFIVGLSKAVPGHCTRGPKCRPCSQSHPAVLGSWSELVDQVHLDWMHNSAGITVLRAVLQTVFGPYFRLYSDRTSDRTFCPISDHTENRRTCRAGLVQTYFSAPFRQE